MLDDDPSNPGFDTLQVTVTETITIGPQSNRDMFLQLIMNTASPFDIIFAQITGLVITADVQVREKTHIPFLCISNFSTNDITLIKGQTLLELGFWHKKMLALLHQEKFLLGQEGIETEVLTTASTPYILSSYVLDTLAKAEDLNDNDEIMNFNQGPTQTISGDKEQETGHIVKKKLRERQHLNTLTKREKIVNNKW